MHNDELGQISSAILDDLLNDDLLNESYVRIRDGEVDQGMTELAAGLRLRRLESSELEWKKYVNIRCLAHPLKELLHQDPFTRRAFEKPRGYPGDAALLDLIYGRDEGWPLPDETTELGVKIFQYSTSRAAPEGVRARRRFVAETIDRLSLEVNRPDILSLAAGHLREANISGAVKQHKTGRFVALDSDLESLEEIDRSHSNLGIQNVWASVRKLITGQIDLGQFDLVYSTGLFDYLQQAAAQRLAATMFQMLRSNGRILLANFLPGIEDIGYMESYMDWKLIYRTPQEMLDIAAPIPLPQIKDIRLLAEENQNIMFLQVTKR